MIFTFNKWERFCAKLQKNNRQSIPAREVNAEQGTYLVLKHDVETNVPNAYHMACIEQKYGHRGSYYVQAYLLNDEKNIDLLQKIQAMGHEVSYHYDVLDSARGDLEKAMAEFEENRKVFEDCGLTVVTVCQHGNPVVERVGYHSNRDFFRSEKVRARYPDMADIMVNYSEKYSTQYLYFSDAGRLFKLIFDPLNNDIIPSDEKNIPYEDLDGLLQAFSKDMGNIISTHPHRWTDSAAKYVMKSAVFKSLKWAAKLLLKVPFMKKIMGRFYYLAKKYE